MHVDRLWRNARIATLQGDQSGVGLIERGAVAVSTGVWSMSARTPTFRPRCTVRWKLILKAG